MRDEAGGGDSQQTNQTPNEHRTHGLCKLSMKVGIGSEGDGGSHGEEEEEVVKRSCKERARSNPDSLRARGGEAGVREGATWSSTLLNMVPAADSGTVQDAERVFGRGTLWSAVMLELQRPMPYRGSEVLT